MTLTSVGFGVLTGLGAVAILGKCAEERFHNVGPPDGSPVLAKRGAFCQTRERLFASGGVFLVQPNSCCSAGKTRQSEGGGVGRLSGSALSSVIYLPSLSLDPGWTRDKKGIERKGKS